MLTRIYFITAKYTSTYRKKHHLFLIHHFYLHNHLSHHKSSKDKCICHYCIGISNSRMMVFLNVRQNQQETKKSHLKHPSLKSREICWSPEIYLHSKRLLSSGDLNFCLLLFVTVIVVIFTSTYITDLGYWCYQGGKKCRIILIIWIWSI